MPNYLFIKPIVITDHFLIPKADYIPRNKEVGVRLCDQDQK